MLFGDVSDVRIDETSEEQLSEFLNLRLIQLRCSCVSYFANEIAQVDSYCRFMILCQNNKCGVFRLPKFGIAVF